MSSKRPSRSRAKARRSGVDHVQFETLEARNMLAVSINSGLDYEGFSPTSHIFHLAPGTKVSNQLETLRTHVGAGEADSFRLISNTVDKLGFTLSRYQQLHHGVDVAGGVYSVHAMGDEIKMLSGSYIDVAPSTTTNAGLGNSLAAKFAIEFMNGHDSDHVDTTGTQTRPGSLDSKSYVWQDPALAELLGLGGPLQGELNYLNTAENRVELTYKFDVYVTAPEVQRTYVYVNANTGTIEGFEDRVHGADIASSGTSLYDGTVNFTGDVQLVGPTFVFRLRQAVDGVETYDLNNSTSYGSAVDFTNTSSVYTDPSLHTGVQTHWGTENTLKYFQQVHGRNSYDGAGALLRSYVSYGTNYVNAFWNGSFMTYGDGNGTTWGPLVSLDVVGHEIAHGVTQFTANLVYANQSGALNESFSDIFGESVERFARGSNDWAIGGDFDLVDGDGFRSMSDPKLKADPDTYEGQYWYTGTGDNGGVHTNSGVQNKWFYILSVGEAGVNDHGFVYNVTGIGSDDAEAIAYRNLSTYLNANSTYQEARDGAVQAAIDLFGANSQQHISTDEAWEAVGLYASRTIVYFNEIAPEGSLIHDANYAGNIGTNNPDDLYAVMLDQGQRLTVVVEATSGGLLPDVSIVYDGATPVATAGPSIGTTTVIQSADTSLAGDYTVRIAGQSNTTGTYNVRFLLNANIELESLGGATNNSLGSAAPLGGSVVALPTGSIPAADRLAVIGSIESAGTGTGAEDFESGVLNGSWSTYRSHPLGSVSVTDQYGASQGNYALIMHTTAFGSYNLNEAIYTFDAAAIANPVLFFDHVRFGDENHRLPANGFVGHYNGDGVSISADGIVWYPIFTNVITPNNVWQTVEIDLATAASTFGITLNSNFRLKFQQYDNYPIAAADGRGYDNIQIGTQATDDWFSFTLGANQVASIAATKLDPLADVSIELFDSAGNLVTSGVAGTHVTSQIVDFTAPANDTYYIRAFGEGDFSLLVTRNAAFDFELTATQSINNVDGALGHVSAFLSGFAEPDTQSNDAVLNTSFAGVTLSNNGTGKVYAAQSSFNAPTGERVFAPTVGGASGWNDGNGNILRANFDDPQAYVSIDVGSDDASDVAYLRAYDSLGNLLAEVISGAVSNGNKETLSISRPGEDISYIEAAGVGGDITPLDNLVFKRGDVDTDVWTFNASAGKSIQIGASLPGGGPLDFENLLGETGSSKLQLSLKDPNGIVVATGIDSLSYGTRLTGTYEVTVSAIDWDGEYYVKKSIVDLTTLNFDFGTARSPVAPGYIGISNGLYNSGLGYGWTLLGNLMPWSNAFGTALFIDGVDTVTESTFEAAVVNGDYAVELLFGTNPFSGSSKVYNVEGTIATGTVFSVPSVTLNVLVNDGRLTFSFNGLGGRTPVRAPISGMHIRPQYGPSSFARSDQGSKSSFIVDHQTVVLSQSTAQKTSNDVFDNAISVTGPTLPVKAEFLGPNMAYGAKTSRLDAAFQTRKSESGDQRIRTSVDPRELDAVLTTFDGWI